MRYTLQDIRNAYKARNSWWGFFILHPVASLVTWAIANFLPFIRPEMVCFSSFVVGMTAIPLFMQGTPDALLAGGIIVFISNLLDGVDGKLARLKGQTTQLGSYLDTLFDILKHSFYALALGWGQFLQSGNLDHLHLGVFAMAVLLIKYTNENLLGRLRAFLPANVELNPTTSKQAGGRLQKMDQFFARRSLLPMPCGVELLTLMFIVGPLFNWTVPALQIGTVGLLLYSVAYTAMTLWKTRWLTRGIAKDQQKRELLLSETPPVKQPATHA